MKMHLPIILLLTLSASAHAAQCQLSLSSSTTPSSSAKPKSFEPTLEPIKENVEHARNQQPQALSPWVFRGIEEAVKALLQANDNKMIRAEIIYLEKKEASTPTESDKRRIAFYRAQLETRVPSVVSPKPRSAEATA